MTPIWITYGGNSQIWHSLFLQFCKFRYGSKDARSMCCRLRLDTRKLETRGGLFGANPLTGSIGVVTINLPA